MEEIGSSLGPEESLINITDSSGSFNTPEPPDKLQRSESGGVPTSSTKSQSVRPSCSVAKARADNAREGTTPARAKAKPREGPVLRTPSPPCATDVESITTSIVSVAASDRETMSVTSSRQSALVRARELTRKKNQLREAEETAAAEAEAARHAAEAEAARHAAEAEAARHVAEANAARRRAEATQRQLQAELEELELDAELAELSSAKSRASEHWPPTSSHEQCLRQKAA